MSIPNEPVAADRLKSFVKRIESLDEDRQSIMADIREIYAEAKAEGFMVKILRQVISRRRKGMADVREEDELRALYEAQLEELLK